MIKPTLLIVDDEKPTREGLRAALEDRYDVYLAEDAATAMGLLEQESFDVLLTDFRLPNEDGMNLIARAQSLSHPPICLLMTAAFWGMSLVTSSQPRSQNTKQMAAATMKARTWLLNQLEAMSPMEM